MSAPSSRATLLVMVLLSTGWLLGATCDVEDVAPSVEIQFTGATEGATTSFEHPYTGRISADWQVEVDAPSPALVTMDWQVQTSGHEDDEACLLLRSGSGRRVQLVPLRPGGVPDVDLSELTLVRDFGTPLLFSFQEAPPEGEAGSFRLQVPRDSTYLATSLDTTTTLDIRTLSGTVVQPGIDRTAGPTCTEGRTRSFDLEAGTYIVLVNSASSEARALIRETCASVRLVQRTCPGASGDIHRIEIEAPAPGASVSGSLNAEQLGIGDLLAIRATCSPEPCSGRLSVVRLLRPVECLSSSDCPGSEVCTPNGFCETGASTGCSSAAPTAVSVRSGFLIGGSVFLLALVQCRRRRHMTVLLLGSVVFVSAIQAPGSANAATGTEVFLSTGTGTQSFTGELGSVTAAGVSLRLMQGLQFRRLGVFVDIRRDFILTAQNGPPYQYGLQLSRTALGTRLRQPVGPITVLLGAEYWRYAFLNNPLVDITGSASLYHGAGGHLAARWDFSTPLYVEAQTGVSGAPGMRTSTVMTEALLSIGVAGALRERR